MHISLGKTLRRAIPAVIAITVLSATAVQARPLAASLRVEAAGNSLDDGTSYITNTTKFQTDKRAACGGSGAVKTLTVPTAMGILGAALPVQKELKAGGLHDKVSLCP